MTYRVRPRLRGDDDLAVTTEHRPIRWGNHPCHTAHSIIHSIRAVDRSGCRGCKGCRGPAVQQGGDLDDLGDLEVDRGTVDPEGDRHPGPYHPALVEELTRDVAGLREVTGVTSQVT